MFAMDSSIYMARLGSQQIKNNIHLPIVPLHLLNHVQRAVQNELIQVPGLVAETRQAITALLRRAELVLE